MNYPAASSGVSNRKMIPIRRKRRGTNPEEIRVCETQFIGKDRMAFLPSVFLIIMTFWWLILFFIRDLAQHPINQYKASYYFYWITFGTTLFVSIIIFIFESWKGKWKRLSVWGKYFYCVGAFFVNSIIIMVVAHSVQSMVRIEYFGADPEGSVGMVFFPMTFLYFLSGAFIYFTITIIRRFKRPSDNPLKRDGA